MGFDFNNDFMSLYPMKAKGVNVDKIPWDNPNYIWEEKFDGDRRLLWISNLNYNTSRNKSTKTGLPTDKTDNVPHIRDLKLDELSGTILDGEFIHPKGFEYVRRIMGSLPERAAEIQKEHGPIIFMVYDMISYKGRFINHKPLIERKSLLENVFKHPELKDCPYIKLVKYKSGDKESLQLELDKIIESGGEGLIAKHKASVYRLSTEKPMTCLRQDWVKVKKGFNGDFVIMGYNPAKIEYDGITPLDQWTYWGIRETGEYIPYEKLPTRNPDELKRHGYIPVTEYHAMGWIGSIIYGEYRDGQLVEVGNVSSGLNESIREWITNNQDDLIGKVIEIDAMERDKKSLVLRHPVFKGFRDDKLPEECIYENQKG